MRKRILNLAIAGLTSIVGLSSASAHGATVHNWYLAGTGALVWQHDTDFEANANKDIQSNTSYDFTKGYGGSLALGTYVDDQWRVELEGSLRKSKIGSGTDAEKAKEENGKTYTKNRSFNAKGYSRDMLLMANTYCDIPIADCTALYVGGGIGVDFNETELDNLKQENTLFAWQFMAGLTYDICPNWTATLGYRFLATGRPEYKFKATDFDTTKKTHTVKTDNMPVNHSVEFGLRYSF